MSARRSVERCAVSCLRAASSLLTQFLHLWARRRGDGASDRERVVSVTRQASERKVLRPLVVRLVIMVPAATERVALITRDTLPFIAGNNEDCGHSSAQKGPVVGVGRCVR